MSNTPLSQLCFSYFFPLSVFPKPNFTSQPKGEQTIAQSLQMLQGIQQKTFLIFLLSYSNQRVNCQQQGKIED